MLAIGSTFGVYIMVADSWGTCKHERVPRLCCHAVLAISKDYVTVRLLEIRAAAETPVQPARGSATRTRAATASLTCKGRGGSGGDGPEGGRAAGGGGVKCG